MQAKITTGYYTVDISSSLVRYRAIGQRRWRVLFDGRDDGRRFNQPTDMLKLISHATFEDDLDVMLREQLAQPGAIWSL